MRDFQDGSDSSPLTLSMPFALQFCNGLLEGGWEPRGAELPQSNPDLTPRRMNVSSQNRQLVKISHLTDSQLNPSVWAINTCLWMLLRVCGWLLCSTIMLLEALIMPEVADTAGKGLCEHLWAITLSSVSLWVQNCQFSSGLSAHPQPPPLPGMAIRGICVTGSLRVGD